jgi:diguanylate cyclase (GGDEF)-like protein/PAS domain S-box-containing protein
VLIGILILNALVTIVTVSSIVKKIDTKNDIDTIISSVDSTQILVSNYVSTLSRNNVDDIHKQLKKTRQLILKIYHDESVEQLNKMLLLNEDFKIYFQKFVIQTDQTSALLSQTIKLGKNMVTQTQQSREFLFTSSEVQGDEYEAVFHQVLEILWQGQMLISKRLNLTSEQLKPINTQLEALSRLYKDKHTDLNTQKLFYRIYSDTRDYVGVFEKFLNQQKQINSTHKKLNEVSGELQKTATQIDEMLRESIHQHLFIASLLLTSILLIFIFSAILLARFLGREIVRPVTALVDATKTITDGNLSVNISSETDDELGELARCLNIMAKNLNSTQTQLYEKNKDLFKAHQDLEKRVKERTEELAIVNQSLESEIETRKQTEALIRDSEAKFRAMFELSPLGIIRTSPEGKILECNHAMSVILGYDISYILGQNKQDFTKETTPEIEQDKLQQLIKFGRLEPFEQDLVHNSGKEIPVRINSTLVTDNNQQSIWSIVEDITEQKRSEEMIWQQANFDELTGLPNRRMFQDRLSLELRIAKRAANKLALLFLDLDKFKEVNDTLGHEKGDLLLVEASRRIKKCLRESDEIARIGGDEFTIVITNFNDIEDIKQVCNKIIKAISSPFTLGDNAIIVGVSIGITLFPDDADNIEKLMSNADQAMYLAKNEGRNRFSFFTRAINEIALKRMTMVNDMRIALKQHQFQLYYQPIIDLTNNEVYKAEALIRWNHPFNGIISPAEFIPLAEDTGLILDIGNWVMDEVISASDQLYQKTGKNIQLSINKSPIQFQSDAAYINNWFNKFSHINLKRHGILIEITEGLLLDASANVQNILYQYRDKGIQVALDDFGTGYSSLAYLNKFHIDYLKIDQTFIKDLSADSDKYALCEAIIVMAHKLGLKVIAEGIETERQHELLQHINCDFAQGYYYSKPINLDTLETFLKTRTVLDSALESKK